MGPRGNKIATSLVKNADLILAIGTRLGFNSTFYSYENISKTAKIIQVDIDPIAIGRYFPVELGINNDVKIFLDSLISLIKNKVFKNARFPIIIICSKKLFKSDLKKLKTKIDFQNLDNKNNFLKKKYI